MQNTYTILEHCERARLTTTGQVVNIKKISPHGIALIGFKTGGEQFVLNKHLEPVYNA